MPGTTNYILRNNIIVFLIFLSIGRTFKEAILQLLSEEKVKICPAYQQIVKDYQATAAQTLALTNFSDARSDIQYFLQIIHDFYETYGDNPTERCNQACIEKEGYYQLNDYANMIASTGHKYLTTYKYLGYEGGNIEPDLMDLRNEMYKINEQFLKDRATYSQAKRLPSPSQHPQLSSSHQQSTTPISTFLDSIDMVGKEQQMATIFGAFAKRSFKFSRTEKYIEKNDNQWFRLDNFLRRQGGDCQVFSGAIYSVCTYFGYPCLEISLIPIEELHTVYGHAIIAVTVDDYPYLDEHQIKDAGGIMFGFDRRRWVLVEPQKSPDDNPRKFNLYTAQDFFQHSVNPAILYIKNGKSHIPVDICEATSEGFKSIGKKQ